MSNLSDLGTFQLGQVQLGASLGQIGVFDEFEFSESSTVNIEMILEDAIEIAEALGLDIQVLVEDAFEFEEAGSFPAFGIAAVLGFVVLRMNITAVDFCAMVEESGMSVEINDVPARAFTFIKQSGQKFDQGVEILPGDAVMFSCGLDEKFENLTVGDEIKFDGYTFSVEAIINHYFDGNVIYRKSALRRLRVIPDMPKVIGLAASPNLDGKTTLTWDIIDKQVFPAFDHFEIFESTDDVTYYLRESVKSNSITIKNLVPNTKYYYKVRAVDKYSRDGEFSDIVETPIDDVPPAPPTGVR